MYAASQCGEIGIDCANENSEMSLVGEMELNKVPSIQGQDRTLIGRCGIQHLTIRER